MCLTLRLGTDSEKPYNGLKFRWKRVSINKNGTLSGPFRYYKYHKTKWNHAKMKTCDNFPLGPHAAGFHVFVVKSQCRPRLLRSGNIKKVEVSGFLHSGTFNGKKCETYQRIRFVK